MRRLVATFSWAILLASSAAIVRAEVIGPLLPRKSIEVGITVRQVDRQFEYHDEKVRLEQRDTPITFRYGLSTNATVSFELSGTPLDTETETFYTVGATVHALIWKHSVYAVSMGVAYSRTLAVEYDVPPRKQYREQAIDWMLLGQRSFALGSEELTLWAGPWVEYMSLTPQLPEEQDYYESENLLGGIAGAGFLFLDHIVLNGSLAWIDDPEYRLNLAYRF